MTVSTREEAIELFTKRNKVLGQISDAIVAEVDPMIDTVVSLMSSTSENSGMTRETFMEMVTEKGDEGMEALMSHGMLMGMRAAEEGGDVEELLFKCAAMAERAAYGMFLFSRCTEEAQEDVLPFLTGPEKEEGEKILEKARNEVAHTKQLLILLRTVQEQFDRYGR